MAGERERLCAHIRAAKDWLGRAESSLEREEDIKGGLNLMLAQAELQRAKETRRRERFAKLLAPALALVIAVGGIFVYRMSLPPSERSNVAETAERLAAPAAPVQPPIPAEPAAPAVESAPVLADSVHGGIVFAPVEAADAPAAEAALEAKAAPAAQGEPRTAEEVREDAAPAPPTQDMQKLMLAAGRVLRE